MKKRGNVNVVFLTKGKTIKEKRSICQISCILHSKKEDGWTTKKELKKMDGQKKNKELAHTQSLLSNGLAPLSNPFFNWSSKITMAFSVIAFHPAMIPIGSSADMINIVLWYPVYSLVRFLQRCDRLWRSKEVSTF